ncbi:MAG TPA: hypothetical protein VGR62_18040 [Candidatus Binatia bacterium]|jgi:hypothetical protein|nr:hypothetical protein [Candidatus Binatia bacterium]
MASGSEPGFIRRHWLALLGAVPVVWGAIKAAWYAARWVVELVGDFQTARDASEWLPDHFPELPVVTFPVWLDLPNWVVGVGIVLVMIDLARTRAVVNANRPKGGPRALRLRCVEADPPFMPGDTESFGPVEIAARIESGRWEPIPPTRLQMLKRHLRAFLRLGPPPEPSMGFRADERPGTDLFVRVTNYGARAKVSAWGWCLGSFGHSGHLKQYPINWRESGSQVITLRTGESATLHVVRVTRVPKRPDDPEPRLTDWQVVTALGADGRDVDRQFYSHVKDFNDGIVSFAVILECPTNPITRPPASAHYVVENTRDGKAAHLTYKGFART